MVNASLCSKTHPEDRSSNKTRSSRIPFSGMVVSFNNERYLGGCLKRLSFCDELIVVDLGSEDRSVEIAKKLNAQVEYLPWAPVVEQVRENAVKLAHNDWIIFLDPDLYFPTHLAESIEKLISSCEDDGLAAIELPLATCYNDEPLLHGEKGRLRYHLSIFHRNRVDLPPYVHRGFSVKEGFYVHRWDRKREDAIIHFWINSISEAIQKNQRYLMLEGESRHQSGQRFSWRALALDFLRVIKRFQRYSGYRDGWPGIAVTLVQLWYVSSAHLALRTYQRKVVKR